VERGRAEERGGESAGVRRRPNSLKSESEEGKSFHTERQDFPPVPGGDVNVGKKKLPGAKNLRDHSGSRKRHRKRERVERAEHRVFYNWLTKRIVAAGDQRGQLAGERVRPDQTGGDES